MLSMIKNLVQPTSQQAFLDRQGNQPVLSVKRHQWRMEENTHERLYSDESFVLLRHKILERDDKKCCICGFASSAHQQIHHVDHDHNNNTLDNLITICNIDHMCFHLVHSAIKGKIFLAVVPEFTQAEITNMMRIYHCLMEFGPADLKARLSGFFSIFENRSVNIFKKVFAYDLSNGLDIAIALSKLDDAAFEQRCKTLDALRVIPTNEAFDKGQLANYAKDFNSKYFSMQDWPDLLAQLNHTNMDP